MKRGVLAKLGLSVLWKGILKGKASLLFSLRDECDVSWLEFLVVKCCFISPLSLSLFLVTPKAAQNVKPGWRLRQPWSGHPSLSSPVSATGSVVGGGGAMKM